jgi:hypothetical protein
MDPEREQMLRAFLEGAGSNYDRIYAAAEAAVTAVPDPVTWTVSDPRPLPWGTVLLTHTATAMFELSGSTDDNGRSAVVATTMTPLAEIQRVTSGRRVSHTSIGRIDVEEIWTFDTSTGTTTLNVGNPGSRNRADDRLAFAKSLAATCGWS